MNKTSKKAGFLNRFFGKSNMHYWNEKEFRMSDFKVIYIHASGSAHCTLSENTIVYWGLSRSS